MHGTSVSAESFVTMGPAHSYDRVKRRKSHTRMKCVRSITSPSVTGTSHRRCAETVAAARRRASTTLLATGRSVTKVRQARRLRLDGLVRAARKFPARVVFLVLHATGAVFIRGTFVPGRFPPGRCTGERETLRFEGRAGAADRDRPQGPDARTGFPEAEATSRHLDLRG